METLSTRGESQWWDTEHENESLMEEQERYSTIWRSCNEDIYIRYISKCMRARRLIRYSDMDTQGWETEGVIEKTECAC